MIQFEVVLDNKAEEIVNNLMVKSGVTIGEVLRDAIYVYNRLYELSKGGEIYHVDKNN